MEKVENKTPLECLQEEIRIFRKNEEATYDMLALYGVLLQDSPLCDLAILTLTEKVINDFEDSEVTVPFFAKNVEAFIEFKSDELYRILKKYQDIDECKETCAAFFGCYKEGISQNFIMKNGLLKKTDPFNILTMLLSKNPGFVYKLLVSDISFPIRFAMFDILMKNISRNLLWFLEEGNGKRIEYITKEDQEKLPQKKQKLIDTFYRNGSVRALSEFLINKEMYTSINHFLEFGMNVNRCYWDCTVAPSFLVGETISTVGYLFKKTHSLSTIEKLYADECYLQIGGTARDNNDLLILYYIKLRDILNFIKWSHFVVTEDKIRLIAMRLFESIKSYDSSLLKNGRDDFKMLVESILGVIVHKAKNNEEYKLMSEYAELLRNLTDIDSLIAKREKEEQLAIQEQELREQKRKELTAILRKMNDYAQENVPGKRLVKDVEFKENIS